MSAYLYMFEVILQLVYTILGICSSVCRLLVDQDIQFIAVAVDNNNMLRESTFKSTFLVVLIIFSAIKSYIMITQTLVTHTSNTNKPLFISLEKNNLVQQRSRLLKVRFTQAFFLEQKNRPV